MKFGDESRTINQCGEVLINAVACPTHPVPPSDSRIRIFPSPTRVRFAWREKENFSLVLIRLFLTEDTQPITVLICLLAHTTQIIGFKICLIVSYMSNFLLTSHHSCQFELHLLNKK